MDFLARTLMRVDVASRTFSFTFAPSRVGSFGPGAFQEGCDPYFRQLCDEAAGLLTAMKTRPSNFDSGKLKREFPSLFSTILGVANCAPYGIELSDTTPFRSAPYRCAPPKVQTFKQVVNELLDQGVVRPSKSPYASPAFLVPKNSGGLRMVVDYRKVNVKIVFHSYPMPTVEQAFEQFAGAVVFSVSDLNSAYFQIPLTPRSRPVTAFCTLFGLFEFNRLRMGISVGTQSLTRVVDELFADFKGEYVFNYLDDLVVYSRSVQEHATHVRKVLQRLQDAGFLINLDKMVIAAKEIRYLGHVLSSRGISVLPHRVAVIKAYPRPLNLRAVRRFVGMTGFYGRFIPHFYQRASALHALKKGNI